MFDKDKVLQPKVVVHCKSEEEADELREWAKQENLQANMSSTYYEDICYDFNDGSYGRRDFCERGYKVLTLKDIKKNRFNYYL